MESHNYKLLQFITQLSEIAIYSNNHFIQKACLEKIESTINEINNIETSLVDDTNKETIEFED